MNINFILKINKIKLKNKIKKISYEIKQKIIDDFNG
jgi:hypothetical protein